MGNIQVNALAIVGFCLLAFYAAMGVFLSPEWLRILASSLVTMFAVAVMISWGEDAWGVLKEGRIEAWSLGLLGVALLGVGASYSGIYSIVWNAAGRPEHWSDYPIYPLGLFIQACGFGLMSFSPLQHPAAQGKMRPAFFILAAICIALFGYMIGVESAYSTAAFTEGRRL